MINTKETQNLVVTSYLSHKLFNSYNSNFWFQINLIFKSNTKVVHVKRTHISITWMSSIKCNLEFNIHKDFFKKSRKVIVLSEINHVSSKFLLELP